MLANIDRIAKSARKIADDYWIGSSKDIQGRLFLLGRNCSDNDSAWALWRDCLLATDAGQDWQSALRDMANKLDELALTR